MQLVKCKGGVANGCKSDAEIDEFIRNKFVVMYYNQVRFDSFSYGQESIKAEAQIRWLSVNTQMN